jgi:microcystin-dependent protein
MASLTNVYSNYRSTNTDLSGRQDITTPSGSIGFKNIQNEYLYIPVGSVFPYAGTAAPKEFLLCDGTAVSRTIFIALFNVIGTTYGPGNGTTTFNLPDLRTKTIFGLNSSTPEFNTLGKTGGEIYHTLTIDEMPTHNHSGITSTTGAHAHGGLTNTAGLHDHGGVTGQAGWAQASHGVNATISTTDSADDSGTHSHSISADGNHQHGINVDGSHYHDIANQGGNQPHNNLPPYMTLNYIIKF